MKREVWFVLALALVTPTSCSENWRIVRFEEGGFQVAFPATPSKRSMEIDSVFGTSTLTVHAAHAGGVAFFVSYHEIPDNSKLSETAILDAERDRGLRGTDTTLVSDDPFAAAGYSGRAVIADNTTGELRIRTRCFIIDDRIYSLVVVGPRNASTDVVVDRFFQSFSVLPRRKDGR
jgi:hypothetical protein